MLAPEVIFAHGNAAVGALQQTSRTVPIVFPVIGDPVAAGFIDSLARPGGNATGFMNFEFALSTKYRNNQTNCAGCYASGGPS